MKKNNSIVIVLVVGIAVLVNILAYNYFVRLDFTQDHRFTLSKATENILDSLKKPVTVTAYFSENLPPKIERVRKQVKDMLIEYSRRSKGKLVYRFVNPNGDKKLEQKALQAGVQPVIINVRQKDQVKQQKAYLGLTLESDNQKDVIPFIRPGDPMEYDISSSIKKISDMHKPTVAFLQGQGEASTDEMQQLEAQLKVLYDTKNLTLTDSTGIGKKIKTIAIVNPTDTFPSFIFSKLDKFLANGGNILVAFNKSQGHLQKGMGSNLHIGMGNWLAKHHLKIGNQFVIDAHCGQVTVQQRQGMFNFTSNVPFHYFPLVTDFANHPISKGLESVLFRFSNDINYIGDSSLKYVPFVFTSDMAGYTKAPVYFNIRKQWQQSDFPLKKLTLGAAISGKMGGKKEAKMVLFGDGSFAVNGGGRGAAQLPDDNINLMSNAIDWLTDNTGLIGLRTKAITSRPIKDVKDSTKTLLKYLNFLGPIIILLLYALLRSQMNRNKRMKRMEEDYV